MRRIALYFLLIPGVLSGSSPATAEISASLSLNGVASYTQLRQEIYLGALYLRQPASEIALISTPPGGAAIELRITAESWSARRFANHWRQSILINQLGKPSIRLQQDIARFTQLIHEDLLRGDQLAIVSLPEGGTSVEYNGLSLMETESDELFLALLNTWIGSRPPSSGFKQQMVSKAEHALVARYQALEPDDKRRAAIAAVYQPKPQETVAQSEPTTQTESSFDFAPPGSTTVATAKQSDFTQDLLQDLEEFEAPETQGESASENDGGLVDQPSTVSEKNPSSESEPTEIVDTERLLQTYRSKLIRKAYQFVEYPARAVKRNQQGVVVIRATVDRSGKVISLETDKKSNHRLLNTAARAAVESAQPYPEVPADIPGEEVEFLITINFKLAG